MLKVVEARVSNSEFIVPPNKFESILLGKGMVSSIRRDDLTVGDYAMVYEGNDNNLTGNQIEVIITKVRLINGEPETLRYDFRLVQVKLIKYMSNGRTYMRNVRYLLQETTSIREDKQKGKYIRMNLEVRPMVGDIIVHKKVEQQDAYENSYVATSISEGEDRKGRVEVTLSPIDFWEELGRK